MLPFGSTTISLGLSMLSHANKVLIVPLAFATSILLVPASVQYNLSVIQSYAKPAGDTKHENISLIPIAFFQHNIQNYVLT